MKWPGEVQTQLLGIPTLPYIKSANGSFKLSHATKIIVDKKFSQAQDVDGLTAIPPTLIEFANTFSSDLRERFGIQATVVQGENREPMSFFLTIASNKRDYLDAAGRPTAEGYTLTIDNLGIVISGASPLGAWWGTRTVLQQAIVSNGALPHGTGVDAPGWAERGMMLDLGRRFYPPEFIKDMCSYMSFFKQNTFHLHLSDQIVLSKYTTDNYKTIPSGFRLFSEGETLKGLNNDKQQSFTREAFEDVQKNCAARGVNILPELESPGHALSLVKWRPQIGFRNDLSLLNLSHPDTIPTVKAVWKEFLPWFHSKIVSIGADEYSGPAEDYKKFVNTMKTYIRDQAGKTLRIWGTFLPNKKSPSPNEISTDVSVQHWSFSYDNPIQDYIRNGYQVINSDEMYYLVMKCCGYSQQFNVHKTFVGNPQGGPWYPNIFSTSDPAKNALRNDSGIRGSIVPLWNDRGSNTSVHSEAYYIWREAIPALADKQWGGNLTEKHFGDIFPKFYPFIPAQTLERRIPTKGDVIFKYDFSKQSSNSVTDLSPNGYNGKTNCASSGSSLLITPNCLVWGPRSSKGRDYTLTLELKISQLPDPSWALLARGYDSLLYLTPHLTFYASYTTWSINTTIPLNTWVILKIIGRGQRTFASVTPISGAPGKEVEFTASIGVDNKKLLSAPIAFEAPIDAITGFKGELRAFNLTKVA
ncbi:hypothetical protein QQS21_005709 [Conoideocrella luteorostrata]|uniref:beta-N-acetylhexosaminidase n=1 Tax=Conoideocrella luteorostrata TaxID=1105319 RepID=A0AAJ0CP33_9HYPO|nr:hypothetical protein QQS21_005709 [Conoideocrella luteorostrata]